jgi:RNA polymerase sigma-70 factor (ECF subfamily)
MDEKQLIERCVAGDGAAWRQFLQRYGTVIYGAITSLLAKWSVNEPAVAEDIFASIIEKLLVDRCAALRGFKQQSKFTTYLVSIARNRTYDHLRAEKRRPTVSLASPIGGCEDGDEDTLEKVLASDLDLDGDIEVHLTLERVLRDVPDRDGLILKMYYVEGLRDKEIAELLDTSVDAISARKSRALKKIKDLAKERGY